MECALKRLSQKWNEPKVAQVINGKSQKWNQPKMESAKNGISQKWNEQEWNE